MKNMYLNLLVMAVLSFLSMFALMYMMVDRFANVYPNLNQFYMAAMMTAPMVILELLLMRAMYKSKLANTIIICASIVVLTFSIALLRWQTGVDDKQFLKSMIPHHAGALLMCDNYHIEDAEIKELCKGIMASQQSEIDWMNEKLSKLDK